MNSYIQDRREALGEWNWGSCGGREVPKEARHGNVALRDNANIAVDV